MTKSKIRCPACGSSQAYIRRRTGQIVCTQCGVTSPFKIPPENIIKTGLVVLLLLLNVKAYANRNQEQETLEFEIRQERSYYDAQEMQRREDNVRYEVEKAQRQQEIDAQEIRDENAQIDRIRQERQRVGY